MSVWASEFGLSLGQVATAEKSNEITAIPQLLSLVDIRGAIITIDAMGTQTAIAETIIDGGAISSWGQGNQESLYKATVAYIDEQIEANFEGIDHPRDRRDAARTAETRTYIQMPRPGSAPRARNWLGMGSV